MINPWSLPVLNDDQLMEIQNTHGRVGDLCELAIEQFYKKILKKNSSVVDGGAHQAQHTAPLSKLIKGNGTVFAIEAIPEYAQILSEMELPRTKVFNIAIGRRPQTTTFTYVPSLPGWSGLILRTDLDVAIHPPKSIDVNVDTLDSLIPWQKTRIDFIKLDLEGGEFDAMVGARNILLNNRPYVVFENALDHTASLYNYTEQEFWAFFSSVVYSIIDFFGNSLKSFSFDKNQPQPWTFLAFPNEKGAQKVKNSVRKSVLSAARLMNREL
jgi:FkbM family methyltransferase